MNINISELEKNLLKLKNVKVEKDNDGRLIVANSLPEIRI